MVEPVLKSGHPTVVFSLLASGHWSWMYPPRWQREGCPGDSFWLAAIGGTRPGHPALACHPLMRRCRIVLFPPARGNTACSPASEGQIRNRGVSGVEAGAV